MLTLKLDRQDSIVESMTILEDIPKNEKVISTQIPIYYILLTRLTVLLRKYLTMYAVCC